MGENNTKELKNLMERISMYDFNNASSAKKQAWERLQTEELEKLYAEINTARKNIPKETFDAWDNETFNIIGKIIADRRADDARRNIARMMELAGLHNGLDRKIWLQRQANLKKISKE